MAFDLEQLVVDLTDRAEELRGGRAELDAIEAALAVLQPAAVRAAPVAASRTNRGRVLEAVRESPGSPATAIARAAGVTPATARTHLAGLLDAGQVARDGAKRWVLAK